RRSRARRGQDLQRRHEASPEPRRRPAAQPGHPAARRADGRRRSAEPQRDLRESRSAEGRRKGTALHHPLHGGGRAARRSDRDRRSRRGRGRRHAGRPPVARRRRRRRPGDAGVGLPHPDRKEPARLMALVPLVAMVRKDLQLFFSDRRSVIMSFLVPIAIASFFGSIFSGPSRNAEPARIAVSIVDQDDSPISRGIVASAQTDRNLRLTLPGEADAREAVRRGKTVVAGGIPKGFGEAAGAAFFSDGEKPPLGVLYDPSHAMELAMVRGVMTEHVMEAVSREMFGGDQGRALIEKTLPQVQSATMLDDRKRLLLEMLGSVQKFYNQTPGTSG